MGELIFISLVFTLGLASCGKQERERLKAQADSLEYQLHERDSAFNNMMNVLNEVETQIDNIKQQEKIIATTGTSDFSVEEKSSMVKDLKQISSLIDNANTKITSLSKQLDNSHYELNAFKKRLQRMKTDLQSRETSLAQLQEELELKDMQIDELNTEVNSLVNRVQLQTETIEMQHQELAEKETDLNTAYFAVDTRKKLQDQGLITKEGGFLWLGKTLELHADVAQSKFTEVDINDTKKFYVDSDKVELVTEHPSDSYQLINDEGKIKYLEVTDPARFWKISKYLVISVKG